MSSLGLPFPGGITSLVEDTFHHVLSPKRWMRGLRGLRQHTWGTPTPPQGEASPVGAGPDPHWAFSLRPQNLAHLFSTVQSVASQAGR